MKVSKRSTWECERLSLIDRRYSARAPKRRAVQHPRGGMSNPHSEMFRGRRNRVLLGEIASGIHHSATGPWKGMLGGPFPHICRKPDLPHTGGQS